MQCDVAGWMGRVAYISLQMAFFMVLFHREKESHVNQRGGSKVKTGGT